MTYRFFIRLLY